MKKQDILIFLASLFIGFQAGISQDLPKTDIAPDVSDLFASPSILPIKLNYSNKEVNKITNDSTYVKTEISYRQEEGKWRTLNTEIRARGNFRRKNCYFTPIKMKLGKSEAKGTLFEGNKKLKLVMPCLLQKDNNDHVVEEYMAYRLYEVISPYHFKTRLLDIEYSEERGKKTVPHTLKGIFIEDDKKVAARHNGNVLERFVHPLQQDAHTSIQNAFFQFLIGNTDFSTAYQHNGKLLFIDKKTIPLPYDFDMAGLIDASYSVVSVVQNETIPITEVTQRMYRGFKRDDQLMQLVRKEFLNNKTRLMEAVDALEPNFEDPGEFRKAKKFILDFFPILMDDARFKKEILDQCRVK